MMPSTSVQIHSSAASSAAARIDAEKSEPPRPSVVGRSSSVDPLNPVTTGTLPCVKQRPQHRGGARASLLHQRRGVAEHGVGGDDLRGVHRHRRYALGFHVQRHQIGRQALADGHGFIHRARRTLAQHHHTLGDAREFGDQAFHAGDRLVLSLFGQQPAATFAMPRRQLFEIRVQIGLIPGLGLAQRIEQQIGHLGHRRDDHHHRDAWRFAPRSDAPPRGCARPSPCWCRRTS